MDFEQEAPTELGHYLYVYSLAGAGSVRWNKVRPLTASEHEAVGRALDLMAQLLRRRESVVDIAHRDLRDLTDRLTALFVDLDFIRQTEAWLPELRYRFAAVSTALRIYDEATTAEARRLGDPAAVERVRSLFRTAYDSSYAYRLVYALRNPLIHGAGEMIDSKVRSWLDAQEEKHAELTLSLRRDAFVASDTNAKVRKETAALASAPDLIEAAAEAVDWTRQVEKDAQHVLYLDRDAAIDLLYGYFEEARAHGGGAPHFHSHPPSEPFSVTIADVSRTGFDFVIADVERRRHFPSL